MKLIPYIFCHGDTNQFLNLEDETLLYDCTRLSSHPFFELLEKLDQACFGGQGMGMERWTFYDCGAMPGVIYGYAIKRDDVTEVELIKSLGFEINDHEYLPLSMFIAIPKLGDGNWFAHNLCSIGGKFKVSGLGIKTKVDGLNAMRVKNLFGATQWGSPAVHIHSQIADLELISAYTPNHSYPYTLTYKCRAKKWEQGETKRISSEYDRLIKVSDKEAINKIQIEIEKGLKVKINGRPELRDGEWCYPLSIYK